MPINLDLHTTYRWNVKKMMKDGLTCPLWFKRLNNNKLRLYETIKTCISSQFMVTIATGQFSPFFFLQNTRAVHKLLRQRNLKVIRKRYKPEFG